MYTTAIYRANGCRIHAQSTIAFMPNTRQTRTRTCNKPLTVCHVMPMRLPHANRESEKQTSTMLLQPKSTHFNAVPHLLRDNSTWNRKRHWKKNKNIRTTKTAQKRAKRANNNMNLSNAVTNMLFTRQCKPNAPLSWCNVRATGHNMSQCNGWKLECQT